MPVLAAVNRVGFMTESSQPGEPIRDGSGQRAFVDGFCSAPLWHLLKRLALPTELVLVAWPPGSEDDFWLPVTVDDGSAFTWARGPCHPGDLDEMYADDLHPAALVALKTRWQVRLIDPVWGRDDLLWSVLEEACGAAPLRDALSIAADLLEDVEYNART